MDDVLKILAQKHDPAFAGAAVEVLTGDVSTRKYYRLKTGDKTFILMQMEPFKGTTPFIVTGKYLRDRGVHVPEVYFCSGADGLILLEDFGDVSLQMYFQGHDWNGVEQLYSEAIDQLLLINCSDRSSCSGIGLISFSREIYNFEFNYFVTNCVEGFLGLCPDDGFRKSLFSIIDFVLTGREALVHRDYHSRNIQVLDGEGVGILDFQDTRWGHYLYDLASLVEDPYVKISDKRKKELIKTYLDGAGFGSFEKCRSDYCAVALQRLIKAMGTFAAFYQLRGRKSHLKYLSPTMDAIFKIGSMDKRFDKLIHWFRRNNVPEMIENKTTEIGEE